MATTTIDMRPEKFELPFKHEQLDRLEENRLRLWHEKGRTLGEGSIFAWCESGMEVSTSSGDMQPHDSYSIALSKDISRAIRNARDFIWYHERHAGEHGGLNVDDCHEWGNAKDYDGGDIQPRSLLYGVRLSYNDGSVLFLRIESKLIDEL